MTEASQPSWQSVFAIFEECVELPKDQQEAFLDQACENAEIRQMVEGLIDADGPEGDTTIERPIIEQPLKSLTDVVDRPETIGSYRILRRVGQGGMSTVYLAVRADDAFRRHVAVKLVRRGMESEPMLRRLRVERQILASLDHPYIARLYDGGSTEDGLPYFVMEYVEGVSLDRYCEDVGLGLAERIALFRKVCAAVHYAHQNLVIHRDIKPSNILVTANGDPKLLDFGIARLLNPDLASAEAEPTATWQRILTPSYASPEQMRGQQVTTGSDVYSLGVLFYKLLTGRLPRSFKGRTQSEIESLLSDTEPLPPSTASPPPEGDQEELEEARSMVDPGSTKAFRKQLAGDLDAIVLKALRTGPAQRYGSVEQLDADLESYQQGRPVTARVGTWRYKADKFVRRNRTPVALVSVLALLLIAVAVAMTARSAQVARERDQARLERDKKQEVLKLVLDIFRFSNPYVLPGEDLTVREALARSVPVLETGLRDQPEVRSELLHTSGSILNILGDYHPAEDQLEEAYRLRRELYGDQHVDVIETMNALASTRKELGEYEDAEALVLDAVALARGVEDDSTEILVAALNELVSVRCYRSQHEDAEEPAHEALALARQLPAVDQEIETQHYLALIESNKGDYVSAETRYRRSLALGRKYYGEEHPVLISSLNNLGMVLRRQEKFDASESVYKELVAIQSVSFGEDYQDPFTLANIGGLYLGQGKYSEAAEMYGKARQAVLATSGPDNRAIFFFELAIEDSRLQSGHLEEAEGNLRRLIVNWSPIFGEDHWRIYQAKGILGESLSLQGKCEEAEPLLTESFDAILSGAKARHKDDALERLRSHFQRCGTVASISQYEAMIASQKE